MKHLLRKYETKHFSNIPCTEGALHGAKLRFIFHTPKACFIFCKNSLIFAKVYRSVPVFLCNNRVTGNKRQETGDKGQGTGDKGQGTGAHYIRRGTLRVSIYFALQNSIYATHSIYSLCEFDIFSQGENVCLHPTPYTLHPTPYTLHKKATDCSVALLLFDYYLNSVLAAVLGRNEVALDCFAVKDDFNCVVLSFLLWVRYCNFVFSTTEYTLH